MKYRREDRVIVGGRKLYLYRFDDYSEANKKQALFWGVVSENWKKHAAIVEEWFLPVTSAMVKALGAGPGRLIDAGCGTQTMPLPPAWDAIGFDIARGMLQPHNTFVGSYNPLALRREVFDAAISRFALMFASDPAFSFRELARVLKPGGKLVFSVWASKESNAWSDLAATIIGGRLGIRPPEPDEPHAFRLASTDETAAMLRAAGFEKCSFERIGLDYLERLGADEAISQILRLAGPLATAFAKLPDAERADVRAEIVTALSNADATGHAFVWSAVKS